LPRVAELTARATAAPAAYRHSTAAAFACHGAAQRACIYAFRDCFCPRTLGGFLNIALLASVILTFCLLPVSASSPLMDVGSFFWRHILLFVFALAAVPALMAYLSAGDISVAAFGLPVSRLIVERRSGTDVQLLGGCMVYKLSFFLHIHRVLVTDVPRRTSTPEAVAHLDTAIPCAGCLPWKF